MPQTSAVPLELGHLFLVKCAVTLHYMSISCSVHKRPWPTSSFGRSWRRASAAVLVVQPEPGAASGRPGPSAPSERRRDTDSLC